MSGGHGGHGKRLGDGTLPTEDMAEGLGHVLPFQTYVKTLVALLVLTVITVIAAEQDFGALNVVIALGIATIKALIVSLFFMHLKFEGRLIVMYAIYPIILVALLVSSNVVDVKDRAIIAPRGKEPPHIGLKELPAVHGEHGHAPETH
jgi:cytochrome c oxidase subunit IV